MRMFHYAVMWAFGIFTLVHVYLVFYHDYVEGHGVLSSMVGGWKFMEKKHAEAELATGISPAPATRPTTAGRARAPRRIRLNSMFLLDTTLVGEGYNAPAPRDLAAPVLILAVGNLLMGDEGVGVHILRSLENEPPVPGARLLDGGVAGIDLLEDIQRARAVIMIDATRDLVPRHGSAPPARHRRRPASGSLRPRLRPEGSVRRRRSARLHARRASVTVFRRDHQAHVPRSLATPSAAVPEVLHSVRALAARLVASL